MYIGLDLGTSGLKGIVLDDSQTIVAEATAPLDVQRPHPGWSEQDPAAWITAAEQVLEALKGQTDVSSAKAIGLSGQMHGATLVNKSLTAIRPAILWNDTRASKEAAALDTQNAHEATGNIVFPGFTAPKINWLRTHEPDSLTDLWKVLLPKDYLRLWLTGEAVTDPSDAAGTSWLDTANRDWSDAMLTATGLTRDHMPTIAEGPEKTGEIRDDLAARFGLPKGLPVAAGGGDNAASAIGLGIVKPGQAFVSLGTSGVLFAPSDGYRPAPETAVHTFCHALPDTWHQMGVILSATDSLNWLASQLDAEPKALTDALGPLQAPERPLFLPYLGGERTPHNDARIRAQFLHLDHATDREGLTRAVVEGVTHALRDCRDALAATGTRIDRLLATGGGARSTYWLQAIATSLDTPIDVPETENGAAFGAARLAMLCAGQAGVLDTPRIARRIDPDPALTDAFTEAHTRYKAAYTALKGLT
ncbi:xylulokinase [Aestuariibius sp. 2305UL40-4]|uniref:xylulokinase n=1 Tax=Aestuariibius violaceus TaxID=3234132 RepID=UPI00345EA887